MKAHWKLTATAMLAALFGMAAITNGQIDDCASITEASECMLEAPEFRIADISLFDDDSARSPSDIPIELDSGFDSKPDSDCCTSCCGGRNWSLPCNRCCCDEAWRLFPTTCRGIDIYGWVAAGYSANDHHPISRFNGPVTFNDRDREFQMNQAYLVAEKTTDPDACGLQFGGRADIVYGTDGRFTQANGLELSQLGDFELNSGQRFYHLAFPQFYLEARKGDISVIAGHFYTIIGYEVVPATGNFFYSHAYTMQYGEPFTHTGILASWQATDRLEIKAGIHNGWDNFTRENARFAPGFPAADNHWGFLGGLFWNSCDGRTSLAATVTMGDELSNHPSGFSNRYMYSLVASQKIGCNWEYVIQHDNGWQHEGLDAATTGEWYGINQYLFYTINDCWKFGIRAEWFRDDDAIRVAALDFFNPASVGGFSGDFYEVTIGLNWTPRPNITIRPEIRMDWFDNANIQNAAVFGDDGTGAAEDNEQFMFAIDGIITF